MNLTQDLPAAPTNEEWAQFLKRVLANFNCETGTLHSLDPADGLLKLVTCEKIPEALIGVIGVIPIGKGIAGAAAERKEPVELCNLQTDGSGVARPDAKKTGVQGTLAVPVLGENDELRGTLGIGMTQPHDFSEEEKAAVMAIGREIADRL